MTDLLKMWNRFPEKYVKLIGCQLPVPLSFNPGLVNNIKKTQRLGSAFLSVVLYTVQNSVYLQIKQQTSKHNSANQSSQYTRCHSCAAFTGGFTRLNSKITTQPHSEQQRRCEYVKDILFWHFFLPPQTVRRRICEQITNEGANWATKCCGDNLLSVSLADPREKK